MVDNRYSFPISFKFKHRHYVLLHLALYYTRTGDHFSIYVTGSKVSQNSTLAGRWPYFFVFGLLSFWRNKSPLHVLNIDFRDGINLQRKFRYEFITIHQYHN